MIKLQFRSVLYSLHGRVRHTLSANEDTTTVSANIWENAFPICLENPPVWNKCVKKYYINLLHAWNTKYKDRYNYFYYLVYRRHNFPPSTPLLLLNVHMFHAVNRVQFANWVHFVFWHFIVSAATYFDYFALLRRVVRFCSYYRCYKGCVL